MTSAYALHQTTSGPRSTFVIAHGPASGVERWEEQGGYSPSTIAAEIAGPGGRRRPRRRQWRHEHRRGLLAGSRTTGSAAYPGLDADHHRPAGQSSLLHPPLEDRRSKRSHLVQRRQRRSDAGPAHRDRRRASSSWSRLGLALAGRPSDRGVAARGRRHDPGDHCEQVLVGIATTATATATCSAMGIRGPPRGQGTGHLWPVLAGRAR